MPGHDCIQRCCFQKFTSMHDRLAIELNRCLEERDIQMDDQGKTTQIQNEPKKEITPNNYWPKTYPPMMLKILTAQIREEIYFSFISYGLFSKEQPECRKGTKVTEQLLYIDQYILKESKTRRKNVAMAWTDNKRYDLVPQSWIIDCLKMYKISG